MKKTTTAMALEFPSDPRGLMPITMELKPPGPNEVIIAVHRAGVAYGDIMRGDRTFIASRHWPWIPGYDVSGRVEILGCSVSGLTAGQRVCAWTGSGGYSRYVRVHSSMVMGVPEKLSDDDAAALVLNYVTAHQLLFRVAGLKREARILIHGAAGGVGTALLDAARHAGITVYGRVSARKAFQVSALGGIPVIQEDGNYLNRIRTLETGGLDAVFDPVSFENARQCRKLLKPNGFLVCYGFLGMRGSRTLGNPFRFVRQMMKLSLGTTRRTRLYMISPVRKKRWFRDDLAEILKLAENGIYKPVIDSVHPLEEANEAQDRLTTRQSVGKVLLSCEKR